jgi:hypothetical protein
MSRKPRFDSDERAVVVGLLREHGSALRTHQILTARGSGAGVFKAERELAQVRKDAGFEKPVSVCLATIAKIAREEGLNNPVGRPRLDDAEAA